MSLSGLCRVGVTSTNSQRELPFFNQFVVTLLRARKTNGINCQRPKRVLMLGFMVNFLGKKTEL